MKNKKILITGAAGFIGYNLFERLSKYNHVIGLDNLSHPCGAEINCIIGDVRNAQLIEHLIKNFDIVYHLAAQTHVDRSYKEKKITFDVNVNGTENILKACKEHNKKVIFASSCEVYGAALTEFISEEHPLNPQNPYAESKKQAEELCIEYFNKGVDVTIIRSFNTFGPYQSNDNYGAVIPIFIKNVSEGKAPEIFGDGKQTRDFMYINDAVIGYEIISDSEIYGKAINIASGKDTSINDIANKILELFKSDLKPIYTKPRPNEVMKSVADISKAKKLGFNPKISLEEGLRRYIDWYKDRKL